MGSTWGLLVRVNSSEIIGEISGQPA